MLKEHKKITNKKTFNNFVLFHKPSGFYVTGADTFTNDVSKAKIYETNAKRNPTEWHDKLASGDYAVISRSENITVTYEEVPF